jgi:hypothetical protein
LCKCREEPTVSIPHLLSLKERKRNFPMPQRH